MRYVPAENSLPASFSMTSFSILIPTRDRPGLLPRAVASAIEAMGNCPDDGEILIVDDHSTQPAKAVLSGFTDPRIRILHLPRGETGVSAARNLGIAAATGEVVFFLDDDDVLDPAYCSRILSRARTDHDYGFCCYLTAQTSRMDRPVKTRVRFPEGTISPSAPLHRRICGFGMGFWLRRNVAQEMGSIDTDLSINEDTDYLCRLILAGKRGWYDPQPGVTITSHSGDGNLNNLTARTGPAERARCMRIVCDRFPSMIGHLGRSYIRHCAKAGLLDDALSFLQQHPDPLTRLRFQVYLHLKRFGYRMRRAKAAAS